ncbi:hypothetical protein ACH4ZX_05530 [Streptomyces sp. NPDC020490]|uniref:hypothetical protein n=1 Tax=Streptomyces sp. NPDC020490 TaxID=3365078 RepID=UPI00379C3ADD
MSDVSGGYTANAEEVRRAAELINKIAAMSGSIVSDFADGAAATSGWEGDDDYGKSLRPNLEAERTSTLDTGRAVAKAIEAASHGSLENARNILQTQDANLGAIHQAKNNTVSTTTRH